MSFTHQSIELNQMESNVLLSAMNLCIRFVN